MTKFCICLGFLWPCCLEKREGTCRHQGIGKWLGSVPAAPQTGRDPGNPQEHGSNYNCSDFHTTMLSKNESGIEWDCRVKSLMKREVGRIWIISCCSAFDARGDTSRPLRGSAVLSENVFHALCREKYMIILITPVTHEYIFAQRKTRKQD